MMFLSSCIVTMVYNFPLNYDVTDLSSCHIFAQNNLFKYFFIVVETIFWVSSSSITINQTERSLICSSNVFIEMQG